MNAWFKPFMASLRTERLMMETKRLRNRTSNYKHRQIINIVNAKQGWGDFLKNVKNSFQEFFKYSCDMLMLLNVKVMHAILCLFEILLWLSIEVLIVCFNYQFNCDWFKAARRWHGMKSELNSHILFTSVWYMYSIVCTCIN